MFLFDLISVKVFYSSNTFMVNPDKYTTRWLKITSIYTFSRHFLVKRWTEIWTMTLNRNPTVHYLSSMPLTHTHTPCYKIILSISEMLLYCELTTFFWIMCSMFLLTTCKCSLMSLKCWIVSYDPSPPALPCCWPTANCFSEPDNEFLQTATLKQH